MDMCLLCERMEGLMDTSECAQCQWEFDYRHVGWQLWVHFVSWCMWLLWYACHLDLQLTCEMMEYECKGYCKRGHNWDNMYWNNIVTYTYWFKTIWSFICNQICWLTQTRLRPGHNTSLVCKFFCLWNLFLWVKKYLFNWGLWRRWQVLILELYKLICTRCKLKKLSIGIMNSLHICK